MTTPSSAYAALEKQFARISALEAAQGMLHWDSAVIMPVGGAEDRGDQLAALAAVTHDLMTAPQVGDWLAAADPKTLDLWQQANLAEMRRLHAHATAVPADLVEALSRAGSACEQIWRQARPSSDFAQVQGALETVVSLTRQSAQAKAAALGVSPYDALLDQYEPGGSSSAIDALFADLAEFLPGFLNEVLEAQGPEAEMPQGPFDLKAQEELGRRLMQTIGFDFSHGRLDVSAHPFCGGTPGDVRITTRYSRDDFASAMMGVLHETGHGMYERGLPVGWRTQPVGRARGMSLHESQSLLMEMQACRSLEFFRFAAPLIKEAFKGEGSLWEAEAFHRRAIRVRRGFIRVDADEVTYPLHVILRYRLEKALVDGSLAVADLPEAWNSGFESLMGVPVPEHRLGVLQDIHWYDGAIGYFPTYTLGAMTAAQLYAAALQAVPEIPDALARGNFAPLLGWLRTHVHSKASSLSTDQIIRQATGKPLDSGVFKAHLRRRYLGG